MLLTSKTSPFAIAPPLVLRWLEPKPRRHVMAKVIIYGKAG
jgi:hypothetical protein